MVKGHLYYYKMENMKEVKSDIISANIKDLEGLIKVEQYINRIRISKLFTKHHKQLIVEEMAYEYTCDREWV